ncbi:MAG: DUF4386 domain-containing protein [Candidatus Marinimicrobia bacterium]|nr:DUF4386 domain-containing protein [Candidatus Neomarinimicrobiota bacterium]
MTSTNKKARIAGLFYIFLVIAAPWRLMYIPGKLFVRGDATATAANIAANESLFRFGLFSDLLTGVIMLFLVLALYKLFKDVDKTQAILMVILGGLMITPIYFLNVLNDAGALMLVRGGGYLAVFDKSQLDALAMLFLRLHSHGVLVNEIFWGLWLFPFGILVIKSGFLPRFLGVIMILNGIAYLILSLTGLLFPDNQTAVARFLFPVLHGELVTMLWLLIKGVNEQTSGSPAT